MAKRRTANGPQLKFHQKLTLYQYILTRFGVESFDELAANMKKPSLEVIDAEGMTGFYKQLILEFGAKCALIEEWLAQYDLNISSHLR